VFHSAAALEEGSHHADDHESQGDVADVKGDKLGGDGGADIGAHHHSYGLLQGHYTGVDQADEHHGGG